MKPPTSIDRSISPRSASETAMDHFDFVCDEGFSSLRILSRTPDDRRKPPVSLRAEIRCTDCVAALDVESECWQGLAKLFARNDETRGSTAWISTAGEWKLTKRGTFDDVPRFGFQQTLRLSSRYGPVGRTSRPSTKVGIDSADWKSAVRSLGRQNPTLSDRARVERT